MLPGQDPKFLTSNEKIKIQDPRSSQSPGSCISGIQDPGSFLDLGTCLVTGADHLKVDSTDQIRELAGHQWGGEGLLESPRGRPCAAGNAEAAKYPSQFDNPPADSVDFGPVQVWPRGEGDLKAAVGCTDRAAAPVASRRRCAVETENFSVKLNQKVEVFLQSKNASHKCHTILKGTSGLKLMMTYRNIFTRVRVELPLNV